jgi:hypothetical protein
VQDYKDFGLSTGRIATLRRRLGAAQLEPYFAALTHSLQQHVMPPRLNETAAWNA